MSLVGSLEDLGLGDLLQIVHLAAKTGVLRLRGDAGEGQIVFRNGMILEARAKGGPTDLRELLAARRAVAGPLLERAWLEAHHAGRPLSAVLVEREHVSAEAIDELRREQIESAVIAMFSWPSGEFSFEMREWVEDDAELAIDPGLNPQFLALEGTRRADERAQGEGEESATEPPADAANEFGGELIFGDSDEEEATLLAPGLEADEDAAQPAGEVPPHREAVLPTFPPASATSSAPALRSPSKSPVVLIDPSLAVLEWAKAALYADFSRVHVFQRPSLGIDRIRQYLARAEMPIVVVAEDTPADSAAAARDANEIVARLKRQAPAMRVLLLCDESAAAKQRRTRADGIVTRPTPALLADPRSGRERTRIATALAEALAPPVAASSERKRSEPAAPAPLPEEAVPLEPVMLPGADGLLQLRESSARMREGAGRGAVLTEVLCFAAQRFARVALFGVRGDRVVGVAQLGLGRAGGPDDEALRDLSLGSREPAWFRRAIDGRRPLRAAPTDNGDHRLAVLLGNEIPSEAYVAPIVTGERVAALLYADNLPSGDPIGDTAGLEVLLDAAGIALDRALMERTLRRGE